MEFDFYRFLMALPVFIFGAGVISLFVIGPMERVFERIDDKVAKELQRRCEMDGIAVREGTLDAITLDEIEGKEIDWLDASSITLMRRDCKRETRTLFAYVFIISLISEICGYVFVVRQP